MIPFLWFVKRHRQDIGSLVIAALVLLLLGTLNSVLGADVDEKPMFVFVPALTNQPHCPAGYIDPEYAAGYQYRCKLDTRPEAGK